MRRPPRPNLLMIEGKTDAVVANHLADLYGLPRDYYDYTDYEGVEHLLRVLPQRLKESERRRVAVVIDANTHRDARWQAVRNRLTPFGYQVPAAPDPAGTVIEAPNAEWPRAGIWLMPDNTSPGILEHFLQQLVHPEDALLPLARAAVAGIPPEHCRFPVPHRPKAEIYTWLAWQERPGCSFGPAIKSGLLDGTLPLAQQYAAWIRRVFEE